VPKLPERLDSARTQTASWQASLQRECGTVKKKHDGKAQVCNHAVIIVETTPMSMFVLARSTYFFCLKQTQDGNSGTHKLIKMLSNLQYHYKSIKETYVTLNSCINRAPALIFERNSEHCFLRELIALDPHSINISCYKSSQFFCQQ